MTVTVFHNPNCGTSRNVIQLIRDAGHEPEVVEYLKTGWTRLQLTDLLVRMGARPRDVLRVMGTRAEADGLTDPSVSDDVLIDAMVADPVLVNRPIVVTPAGAVLARPKEAVLPLLDGL
ncbi:arsenate reductase (glutaredoxin) [Brevundimonas sp.]|jgi:arsenate reductase|uniref:arsenate reductase (glutaredoxin) n=1 Tax=Brevundimonas sp. TaxID=1871086 RepID=UPI002E15B581|nr:arsenate reductase (glutaredoxin) [Brevundimonas sp.]HEV7227099.1 arsenate reductase (glutaredoxin) [Brevundimonas sp.]